MKNWYFLKKLTLVILISAVVMWCFCEPVMAVESNFNDEWPSYPDGTLPFEWSKAGMEAWNLDLDLTKGKSGDELARKSLSSDSQPTDLIVFYAIPKTNLELWRLLHKYRMRLLLVTCLENNTDEKWHDKGATSTAYCYALDDPITKHVRVHFYDDIGGIYGLSTDCLAPESSKISSSKDSDNYYAFNFACADCYQNLSDPNLETWIWLDQYWGKSYLSTKCENSSVYTSPHSLHVYDKELLARMEQYIIEFRKVRGLPELP